MAQVGKRWVVVVVVSQVGRRLCGAQPTRCVCGGVRHARLLGGEHTCCPMCCPCLPACLQYWNNPALQTSYEQYRQVLGERRQEAQERLEQVGVFCFVCVGGGVGWVGGVWRGRVAAGVGCTLPGHLQVRRVGGRWGW